MKWITQSLRFSAFTAKNAFDASASWWESTIGTQPNERLTKLAPPTLIEAGDTPNLDARLLLEHTTGRIDWQLIPQQKQIEEGMNSFPNIGNFNDELINAFKSIVYEWLEVAPDLNRIAFGVVLHHPVDDKISGYKELQSLLPSIKIDPVKSSDFTYTINRPRISKTAGPELSINRLSKWAVTQFKYIPINITQSLETSNINLITSCKVELDISSPQIHNEVIDKARITLLMEEFITLAKELSEIGDVP